MQSMSIGLRIRGSGVRISPSAPNDSLAAAADALDLSIKREVFWMALVRRLRRTCCGRRAGWICRLCSTMAGVAVSVRAVPGGSASAPGQSQNDRRKGQLAHSHLTSTPKVFRRAPHSSSRWCRVPRQIVRQHIYHDRRQAQHHPDPEHRRMVDASPVARRRCGFHCITSSARRMSSTNGGGLIKTRPYQGRVG